MAQHALIVGEPGAGKSTLMRWLAVTFAAGNQQETDRLGPQADANRLPLLVELGRLPAAYLQADSRETPNWKSFLPEHLTKQPPFDDIPAPVLEEALAAGRCLLLCDGLDEIADLPARRRIANSLADYARGSANRLVLSSRPAGVSGSEGALDARFQRLTIQRFAPEEVQRFFRFWYRLDTSLSPDEQISQADALFASVQAAPKTMELASTPLLATMLFLIWRRDGDLPERRVELYERCCRMLIESWEAHHDVAYTGVLADIGWERHLRLLAPLAYAIHSQEKRIEAPASELKPILAQAIQDEGVPLEGSPEFEAEKFLTTLGLRSGLLQLLGIDKKKGQGLFGFPHLTFQEYLAARHIATQPDPDYIDLVMVDLHIAWWRDVHLLVVGHLGSGSERAGRASRLLLTILDAYPPPWRLLRSLRIVKWIPVWLENLLNAYKDNRVLKWPVYGLAITIVVTIVIPSILPGLARNFLAARLRRQWERRLAWILAREFLFAASGFADCAPLGVNADLRRALIATAQGLLLQIVWDPGRSEGGDSFGIVREAAAGSLVQLGETSGEVVAALVAALGDSDYDVWYAAAGSLVQLGEASGEVVAALVADLGDPGYDVRYVAAGSLVQLGEASAEVVPALVATLGDSDDNVRYAAAGSLGQLGEVSAEVVAALVATLEDTSGIVRYAAAGSLGQLGEASAEVVAALVAALEDTSGIVRYAAAGSLGQLGEASREVVAALMAALGDSDSDVREAAAGSLGQLGEASREVVAALMAALGDSDSDVREAAGGSLVQLGEASGEVVAALVAALDDSDGIVRAAAAGSLGQLGGASRVVAAALVAALGDPDYDVRYAAAGSLGKLEEVAWTGSGEALGEAVSALVADLGDSNYYVREAALGNLVQLGEVAWTSSGEALGKAVSVLVAYLGDSSGRVRRGAAGSLGQLELKDKDQLRRVLIALNRHLHGWNDDVRRAALTAIRRLLDGRQIPGYRWVPVREQQRRRRRRKMLDIGVFVVGLVVLAALTTGLLFGRLELSSVWAQVVGGLSLLAALLGGGDLLWNYWHRPPWER